MLENRDFTIIIDKSGSMGTSDVRGKSRWEAAQESTQAIASGVEKYDPDGLTLYTFSGSFKRYDNVTAMKVKDVFAENSPMGSTALHLVLRDALLDVEKRKKAGNSKANGDLIIVVTDGEPDDKNAVAQEIIRASKTMDRDEELAILFAQVGNDAGAQKFLKSLDDDLQGKGAKFDIVDTITFDEMENKTLTEVLINAIND